MGTICTKPESILPLDIGVYPVNSECNPDQTLYKRDYTLEYFPYVSEEDDILCASNPCKNQGSCQNGNNTYICTCIEGYTGRHCEIGTEIVFTRKLKTYSDDKVSFDNH